MTREKVLKFFRNMVNEVPESISASTSKDVFEAHLRDKYIDDRVGTAYIGCFENCVFIDTFATNIRLNYGKFIVEYHIDSDGVTRLFFRYGDSYKNYIQLFLGKV